MIFKNVRHYCLFGGGRVLFYLADFILSEKLYIHVFSSKRHLDEIISSDKKTLKELLDKKKITYSSPKDLNKDKNFIEIGNKGGCGIGFGETWSFSEESINLFNGKLIDLMGIPLPKYRGGAHFTWMILNNFFEGAVNLQLITSKMEQGVFDDGDLIISKNYKFPKNLIKPIEYQKFADYKELEILKKFVTDCKYSKIFKMKKIKENTSLFFPRLNTKINGWIDWSWQSHEVVKFINAFSEPYNGASTNLNNKRVFLKTAKIEKEKISFHPYLSGLIVRINKNKIFVACNSKIISIRHIEFENTHFDIKHTLKLGFRFFTPNDRLISSKLSDINYNDKGLIKKK